MTQLSLTIHASKLDGFADCPRRAFAELLPDALRDAGYDVFNTPQYVTGPVGSGIHAGVAALHEIKQSAGMLTLPHIEQAQEVARREFATILEREADKKYTQNFPNDEAINAHINGYVSAYADQVLPIRDAQLVEYKFEGQLADDIFYKTTLDLYGTDDVLYDLKTGAKVTPAKLQMGMYLLLLKQKGFTPKGVVLDYMLRDNRRTNTGSITHTPITYNHEDCMSMTKTALTYLIKDFRKFKETGKIDHILVNPRSSMCNHFCPLFSSSACPGWQK